MNEQYLNSPQMKAELEKCLQCKTKPCEKACPAHCSPHDFILAAKYNDWNAAANIILEQNPLAETCGLICPDKFCMQACLRSKIDYAIAIPKVQASIMKKYREKNLHTPNISPSNGKKVAVIGAGPAGMGAAAMLLRLGYTVEVHEKSNNYGGTLKMIPKSRLSKDIISAEWKYLLQNPRLKTSLSSPITNYHELLMQGYDGVICAVGEQDYRKLGIEGEQYTINYDEYLLHPQKYACLENIAIIGGGAVAVDCANTAHELGAKNVEMFVRRRLSDMKITSHERSSLIGNQIDITTMTRIVKIEKSGEKLTAYTVKTCFNDEGKLEDIPQTQIARPDFSLIVLALGSQRSELADISEKIVYSGDCKTGSSTAVEAVADGKKAALSLDKIINNT